MYARIDIALYAKAMAKIENFISLPQGGAKYRSGSLFSNYTANNGPGVLIPFKFSDIQAYMIELTNNAMRFYSNDGPILEVNQTITGISSASPGVVTTSGNHGYANGDTVFISGLTGDMAFLNNQYYYVAGKTNTTYQLTDVFGNNITTNTFSYNAGGGTCARVYTYLHLTWLKI